MCKASDLQFNVAIHSGKLNTNPSLLFQKPLQSVLVQKNQKQVDFQKLNLVYYILSFPHRKI